MDQKRWKFGEVATLKNAVANYKLMHGDKFIVWSDVRVESGLTRFSALEVRQKYKNISREKNRHLTVSDPAAQHGIQVPGAQSGVPGTQIGVQGIQSEVEPAQSGVKGFKSGDQETEIGVQGTRSGVQGTQKGVKRTQSGVQGTQSLFQRNRIRQTVVQPEQCSSAAVNRIATAALKVNARTAIGVELRNYLSNDGGPNRTPKLYMDTLMAALKDGTLSHNYLGEQAKETEAIIDYGRQERQDLAKLRNDEVEVVLEEVTPKDISEQLHCQNFSMSTRTYDATLQDLPEKSKYAKNGGSRQRVAIGLSASLGIEPDVARATEGRPLPADMNKEMQQPPPKKLNINHSLFNDAIVGPYGVLLPTPTGYGANHVLRKFTDNEWRKIILEIKSTQFNILSDAYSWKKLTHRAGISSSLGGLEIQLDFCKYAIPRLEELMACFPDDKNAGLEQEIIEPCQLTDIFIFHSLKILQLDQIELNLRTLSNLKCVSFEKNSLSDWSIRFISNVLQNSNDYFKCKAEDLQNLREDVIKTSLQYCHAKRND